MARSYRILPCKAIGPSTDWLSDGETVSLRHPNYRAGELGYGALHRDAMLSPRVAPQMIGLGLLEAIPAANILALADPQDRNGDGFTIEPQGLLAVCIQHECDHLNGKLFVDYLSSLKRTRIRKKLEKQQRIHA